MGTAKSFAWTSPFGASHGFRYSANVANAKTANKVAESYFAVLLILEETKEEKPLLLDRRRLVSTKPSACWTEGAQQGAGQRLR